MCRAITCMYDVVKARQRVGGDLTECFEILIMLFADDVVLLSYSVIGLQRQLYILRDTVKKLTLVSQM